jgi:hypothetical protein
MSWRSGSAGARPAVDGDAMFVWGECDEQEEQHLEGLERTAEELEFVSCAYYTE